MSTEVQSSPIAPDEKLARFILSKSCIRNDNTVKQDAFLPFPHRGLSVTRHKNLSEQELWRIGQDIADMRPATLYGRADLNAAKVRSPLEIKLEPLEGNPNHANIVGWPEDKPAQKMIAMELAKDSTYHSFIQS